MPRTATLLTALRLCALAPLLVTALLAAACEPDPPTTAPTPTPTTAPVHRQASAATDRDALTALYRATGGDSWSNNTNWLSDAPIGQWHGVSTDDNGRVTWLLLRNNQLNGEIPRIWATSPTCNGFLSVRIGCTGSCRRSWATSPT